MGFFNHNSHAYRENYSTVTAILQLVDRLYTATDRNMITQLLALDQSSAFNCVNHSILLQKLKMYGCSRDTLKWITNYLNYRTEYTNVGKYNSTMAATTRGVPQGSILGPLLYLIFTNEMSEVITYINCPNGAHNNNKRLFGENCTTCGHLVSYADDATYQVASTNRTQNQLRINLNLARLENVLN